MGYVDGQLNEKKMACGDSRCRNEEKSRGGDSPFFSGSDDIQLYLHLNGEVYIGESYFENYFDPPPPTKKKSC